MESRIRTIAFTILLIGLSTIVLLQAFQTGDASMKEGQAIVLTREDAALPFQSDNSTESINQTLPANSTAEMPANSTALNSTLLQASTTSQSTPATMSATADISSLQFQMTSMNAELAAMSSRMNSISQDTGTNTLMAEGGVILGILAVIAAIAVARRADAMYRDVSQGQPPSSSPAKK
jgi:hypothetical protein